MNTCFASSIKSFFNTFENRKYKELKKLIDSQTISGFNLDFFVAG